MDLSGRRNGRPLWNATAWMSCLAVGFATLFVLTYLLAVRTRHGRLLDGSSLRGARAIRSGLTDKVELVLDVVSVTSLLGAAALVAIIALVRLRRGLALAAVVVVVGSTVTSQVLKRLVLERPDVNFYETTPATLNSMPSGHSTIAFSVAVALVLVLPTGLRAQAAWLGAGFASVVAVATQSAGWHRPSDSVAAFLMVGAWAAASGAVLVATSGGGRSVEAAGSHQDTPRRLLRAAAGLLAVAVLMGAVVIAADLDRYGATAQVLAYLGGSAAIAGTSALVMAALLAVTHWIAPRDLSPDHAPPPVGRAPAGPDPRGRPGPAPSR